MIQLSIDELSSLANELEKYDLKSTVSHFAGLLTVPKYQANAIRFEILVNLAAAKCNGEIKLNITAIDDLLNSKLLDTEILGIEDPAEDVFLSSVGTPLGNMHIFEGVWESNDYYLQTLIDVLSYDNVPNECRRLLDPCYELLRLSNIVSDRLGLNRWCFEQSNPKVKIEGITEEIITRHGNAITFTKSDIDTLGINTEILSNFILDDKNKENIINETLGNTLLDRRPLIKMGDDLILSLPASVSPAIRIFILSTISEMDYLPSLSNAHSKHQAKQVEKEGLFELRGCVDSLQPPEPDGKIPSLHGWLFKYDNNKYIHIVILHDRLDLILEYGLGSFMEYPEVYSDALSSYVKKVADHCKSIPRYGRGITLFIMGGLGRGFALGFKDWPSNWLISVIGVRDLLMLATEMDKPIARYLKFIIQKDLVEKEGFHFINANGDYNHYCYWRYFNYQLVPRELPVKHGSVMAIPTDMVAPIRKETRELVDNHLIQTVDGGFSECMRFGRDAYFKSMQSRPIYASLNHIESGILAGVIETSRGPSWIIVETSDEAGHTERMLYEMWSGFIGLFDRLVGEAESIISNLQTGPLEIRLIFSSLKIEDINYEDNEVVAIQNPDISVNNSKSYAIINFPKEVLLLFQQSENKGEKYILGAIANALVCLHENINNLKNYNVTKALVKRVLGDSGARIIHMFRTFYPIEYLLAQHNSKPRFLLTEDFVFSKLNLSSGCVDSKTTELVTKSESNAFLHKVVEKIWLQIKASLKKLNRKETILECVKLHEAVIQDRDHWKRTSQAVLALYSPVDDVHEIALDRENDRNTISLSVRTLLEMAICECPIKGRSPSRFELDEIYAKIALLIEVATDSDAVNSGLVEPNININLNGEYDINREFHKTVIKPFLKAYFNEGFDSAASEYSDLYKNKEPSESKRADEVFSKDFINAFEVEYDLTPDQAIDGFAVLMDIAVEKNNVVVESSVGELKKTLIASKEFTEEMCNSFIRMFSISHRPKWEIPPSGFKNRDINPWRFRRRLSATAKPIFLLGESEKSPVIFGAGSFQLGFWYLLDRTESGHLPQEYYLSTEMKQYIGKVNSERGLVFARTVADKMKKAGWNTLNEVNMTQLGAPSELGDVDVLAWNSAGEVQIIECKRLQLARTVAEVAEICSRFKGEAKDELAKHIRRVDWIVSNQECLKSIIGFVPLISNIDHRLVTNTHVPMMYISSLPISSDKIGPLNI